MRKNSSYSVPINIKIFKSNYDYFNGIGKFSQTDCVERSLLISGIKKVDYNEYENYIENNQLKDIFKLNS